MKYNIRKILTCVLVFVCFAMQSAGALPIFDRNGQVLILTYHKLSELQNEWSDFCISPKTFEDDIKFLKGRGYTFMTASELAKADTKGKKTAVITFDDGYESDIKYAAPVLEKYNAKATFFIIGGAIGTPDYMSKQQIAELSKKACAEIGSHSDKIHFKKYQTLTVMYRSGKYNNEIINDFKKNDEILKEITGNIPSAVSYPNGLYSPAIDKQLKKDGKIITFSTHEASYGGVKKDAPTGRRNRGCLKNIADMARMY